MNINNILIRNILLNYAFGLCLLISLSFALEADANNCIDCSIRRLKLCYQSECAKANIELSECNRQFNQNMNKIKEACIKNKNLSASLQESVENFIVKFLAPKGSCSTTDSFEQDSEKLFDSIKNAVNKPNNKGTIDLNYILSADNSIEWNMILGREEIFNKMCEYIKEAKSEIILSTFSWDQDSNSAKKILDCINELQEMIKNKTNDQLKNEGYTLPIKIKIIRNKSVGMAKKLLEFTSNASRSGGKSKRSRTNNIEQGLDKELIDFDFMEYEHSGFGSNHAKYLVADGKKSIITSANVQDRDMFESGLTIEGSASKSLLSDFSFLSKHSRIAFSNNASRVGKILRFNSPFFNSKEKPMEFGNSEILTSTSKPVDNFLTPRLTRVSTSSQNAAFSAVFEKAKNNIKIFTPNLNFSDYDQLILKAIRRGVNVQIILSKDFNDQRQKKYLLQGGTNGEVVRKLKINYDQLKMQNKALGKLEMRYYQGNDGGTKSHVKYMSADDSVTIIGSANLDTQSWYHSHELNFIINDSMKTNSWNRDFFGSNWDKSSEIK